MRETSEQVAAKYKNALSRAMQATTPWDFKACVGEALAVLSLHKLEEAPYVTRLPAINGVQVGSPHLPTLHSLLDECSELTGAWAEYSARERGVEMRHLYEVLKPEFDISVQGWIAEHSKELRRADDVRDMERNVKNAAKLLVFWAIGAVTFTFVMLKDSSPISLPVLLHKVFADGNGNFSIFNLCAFGAISGVFGMVLRGVYDFSSDGLKNLRRLFRLNR